MIDRIRKSFAAGRECHHGGKVRQAASLLGALPLDFSANINPLGSPRLDDVVLQELKSIGHYPDNTYREYRASAAEFAGVMPENIIPGNGSSEIIRLFAEVVLEEGDLALVPTPTFGEYEAQSRLAGGRIKKVPIAADGVPVLSDEDLKDAKALFLCNPNNPTGVLLPRKKVLEVAKTCESRGIFLLVDEAFIELADPRESIADIAPDAQFILVMRSLTKDFGVPGLRLGFGIASAPFVDIMNTARIPWSIGSIAAAAGVYLLNHAEYLEESRALIKVEREWLTKALFDLGFRPYESSVNFILADVKGAGIGSVDLTLRMMREGVLIRECSSFGLKDHIRVAVRKRDENERLIAALKKVLSG